jgi:hypothetical protein
MSQGVGWYRSSSAAPHVRPSVNRGVRNWLRARLPEPDVRGKTMVLYSRRTFPRPSSNGLRSEFHGLFSEFHSVLGALAYGRAHGAAGVRVEFRSPLYAEPGRGPNWWTYFFESDEMSLASRDTLVARGSSPALPGSSSPLSVVAEDVRIHEKTRSDVVQTFGSALHGRTEGLHSGFFHRLFSPAPLRSEVHLNGIVTKYGRYGGFSDVVGGPLAYLYPMTYAISRPGLNRLLTAHVHVRPEIVEEAERVISKRFEPGAYVVGVHFRGTDATHNWTGALTHYRTTDVPYQAYAEEIRRVLAAASNRASQVFVATDEREFLEFMRREFGPRVLCHDDAPRVPAHGQAIHLDRTLPISNYQKGKSAIVDCLILAATSYLVKGRSNLSDASLAFNPHLPYSFLPDLRT